MARIRNIKPEFFTDEDIGELDIWDRLFYVGLWTLADKAGRLADKPKSIKVRIFPYDEYNAEAGLKRLEEAGFIKRYEAEGLRLIWIVKFTEHQCFSGSEHASKLPKHPDDTEIKRPKYSPKTVSGASNNSCEPVEEPLQGRSETVGQHADTGHRTQDKGQKPISSPEGDGKSDKTIYPTDFETFWKSYPKKEAKGEALKVWKSIQQRPSPEELVTAVGRKKKTQQWQDRQFIPQPARWLRGRGWEDEDVAAPTRPQTVYRTPAEEQAGEYHTLFTLMFERGQEKEMLRSIGKLLSLSAQLTPEEQAVLAEYEPKYPKEFAAYRKAAQGPSQGARQ